jgi:hypothetical protein
MVDNLWILKLLPYNYKSVTLLLHSAFQPYCTILHYARPLDMNHRSYKQRARITERNRAFVAGQEGTHAQENSSWSGSQLLN